MINKIPFVVAIALAVAGCKEDTASCTKEELGAKATELATKLQENPAGAVNIIGDVQELATKFQGLAADGEPSAETINELCIAYDGLLEKL